MFIVKKGDVRLQLDEVRLLFLCDLQAVAKGATDLAPRLAMVSFALRISHFTASS